jgi:hypothetical protein
LNVVCLSVSEKTPTIHFYRQFFELQYLQH